MLLCTECSDSLWTVSQEADGVHLKCKGVTRTAPNVFTFCDYTAILPHGTVMIPTARSYGGYPLA